MGHGTGGGGRTESGLKIIEEKLPQALIIKDVKIVETTKEVIVPKIKYVYEEQTKYNTKEEDQIKFNTKIKETVKYDVKEETTVKYNKVEEPTVKYIPKAVEVPYEKPVPVDTPYERPVIHNKDYTVATVTDMENVRALMKLIPEMSKAIDTLRKKVESLVDYKLVEKVIEAPRIEWIPTPGESIVWKNVEREKPV